MSDAVKSFAERWCGFALTAFTYLAIGLGNLAIAWASGLEPKLGWREVTWQQWLILSANVAITIGGTVRSLMNSSFGKAANGSQA